MQLREVHKALSDHIKQFILGISSKDYAPLKDLIFKGVEKGIEDCQSKYKQCKSIEKMGEEVGEKVADFFDLLYEKFETEIEDFFA